MKKFMEKMVVKYSSRICGAVAIVALCCRGHWYQPKEPDDIKKLTMDR